MQAFDLELLEALQEKEESKTTLRLLSDVIDETEAFEEGLDTILAKLNENSDLTEESVMFLNIAMKRFDPIIDKEEAGIENFDDEAERNLSALNTLKNIGVQIAKGIWKLIKMIVRAVYDFFYKILSLAGRTRRAAQTLKEAILGLNKKPTQPTLSVSKRVGNLVSIDGKVGDIGKELEFINGMLIRSVRFDKVIRQIEVVAEKAVAIGSVDFDIRESVVIEYKKSIVDLFESIRQQFDAKIPSGDEAVRTKGKSKVTHQYYRTEVMLGNKAVFTSSLKDFDGNITYAIPTAAYEEITGLMADIVPLFGEVKGIKDLASGKVVTIPAPDGKQTIEYLNHVIDICTSVLSLKANAKATEKMTAIIKRSTDQIYRNISRNTEYKVGLRFKYSLYLLRRILVKSYRPSVQLADHAMDVALATVRLCSASVKNLQ